MRTQNWSRLAGFIAVGLVFTGCSQIRTTNRPSKNHMNNVVIKNEAMNTDACSRGMFILAAHKDLVNGELETNGRGYVTTKVMENPDPYYHLKLGLKPKDPEATEPPDISKNLGPRIEIALGKDTVFSNASSQVSYAMALETLKEEAGIQEETSPKKLVLGWDPKLHAYFSTASSGPKEPLASSQPSNQGLNTASADSQTGTKAQNSVRAGVGTVRSFVFGLKDENAAVAANFPNDIATPEVEQGLLKATIGQTLEIPIAASEVPRDAQGMVTVLIEEASDKPTWRAFYYERDDEGSKPSISIATVGADVDGQKYELKDGSVRLVVSRQIMTTHALGDAAGGNLCTVTGAGITTYGELSPAKDK